jgi:GTP-binding protein
MIDTLAEAHGHRIPTGELNRFLRESVAAMSPHAIDGKLPKLYFMTQVGVRPPSFVVKANTDRGLHFSYVRYLENRLREQFGLAGVPLRLSIQKKTKGEGEETEVAAVRRILDPGEGLKPSRSNESLQAQKATKVKAKPRPKKKEAPKPAAKQAARKGPGAPAKRVRQKSTKKP